MHDAETEAQKTGDAPQRAVVAVRRLICSGASLLVALVAVPRIAQAQLPPSPLPLSNVQDARTLEKGTVLLRVLTSWTRFDGVYDATADSTHRLHPLGEAFSAESLGVRQFPALAGAQAALRTLTQNPNLALNLGQAFSTVDTRSVVTPLSLEYGLTGRLTVGVLVPIVQTHSTVFVELNPRRLNGNTGANVGPNPGLVDAAIQQANQAVVDQLGAAAQALSDYLSSCGCSSAQATQLRAQASQFQAAVATLYGSSRFAPLATSAAQAAIVNSLTALASQINSFLGSSFSFGAPTAAPAPAALLQLQQLAISGAGLDSIGSPDRIGVGDVELSARFKLHDAFVDTTPGFKLRATVVGVLRLPTGRPPSGTVPYEIGTGTGQTSADAGAIFDVRMARRFMATLAGQYTAYFTSANVARMPNSDYALFPLDLPVAGTWREGNVIQLEATPRFEVMDFFTVHAAYAFRHQAAAQYTSPDVSPAPTFLATTEQRAGFGFAYSTVERYARARSTIPFEVSYTHLETLTASGGLVPKYSREQIEVRIYYRLRRSGR
jgi:hypothetical protein